MNTLNDQVWLAQQEQGDWPPEDDEPVEMVTIEKPELDRLYAIEGKSDKLMAALKALVDNPRPAMASGGDDWNARYARYEAAYDAAAALVREGI